MAIKLRIHKELNFEGAYIPMIAWQILFKIWKGRCPTLKKFPQQKWLITIQALSSYVYMKMAFSCFHKMSMSPTRTGCTWLYDTLSTDIPF